MRQWSFKWTKAFIQNVLILLLCTVLNLIQTSNKDHSYRILTPCCNNKHTQFFILVCHGPEDACAWQLSWRASPTLPVNSADKHTSDRCYRSISALQSPHHQASGLQTEFVECWRDIFITTVRVVVPLCFRKIRVRNVSSVICSRGPLGANITLTLIRSNPNPNIII